MELNESGNLVSDDEVEVIETEEVEVEKKKKQYQQWKPRLNVLRN